MRTRKILVLFAVPILLGGAAYGYRRAVPGGLWVTPKHPVLRVPPPFDLGDREQGSMIIPRFTLTNAGGRELVIDDIRSSCACSGLEREVEGQHFRIDSLRLAPGESIQLVMRVAIRGRIGEPVRNQIRFRTKDPNHPEASIEATVAHVTGGMVTVPANMTFGTLVVGQESRQLLEIRDNARSRRAISRVESSDPSKFSVRLLSLDEAAKRGFADDRFGNLVGLAEVTVSASALGPLDGQVLIHADDPGRPPDSIPISAKVANLVEAIPAALILPRASGTGPLFSGGCILRSNTAESMVVQIESLPPGIHVELQKNNLEHNTQVVRIEWRGNTAGSEVIRRVRLNAKVGSRECVVEIPVTIRPVKG